MLSAGITDLFHKSMKMDFSGIRPIKLFEHSSGFFSLTDDGIIGPATWNKIVEVYNGLPDTPNGTMPYPGTPLIVGSSGEPVLHIQQQLNRIRQSYPSIPQLQEDGYFGNATRDAVIEFQRLFLLPAHGASGRKHLERD